MGKYSEETKSKIKALSSAGLSGRKIARELGICKSGVNYFLASCNQPDIDREITTITNITEGVTHPRILLLDIETAPSLAYVFGRFKQNISVDAVEEEGGWLLSYAYKWLGDSQVQGSVLSSGEAVMMRDIRLVQELSAIIEKADYVVWHNGDRFDHPVLKTRTILNSLTPLRKVKSIDTFNLAREFRFNSNKLDGLCKQLEKKRKITNEGITLWRKCKKGDALALATMLEYNFGDIPTLEEVYLSLRSYSSRHPNLAVHLGDELRCGVCLSSEVSLTGNTIRSNLSVFPEYKCNCCNARFRGRTSATNKEERSKFLVN